MSETQQQPVFIIEKIYVKDLSLEIPHAPQVFLEREAPEINLQLDRVHLARVRGTSHVVERNEELVRASPTESVFLSFSLVGETFLYHEDAV
ncbi:MAG: hypothetical protein DYH16_09520, partial [Nitrosomonas sp. PRO5]|nr:hypothetical protein [Nitrosomonas sp. PRO5]